MIRLLLCLGIIFSGPLFSQNLNSPRETMKTFLNSMDRFKLGDRSGLLDAVSTFNVSQLDPLTRSSSVELAAKNLVQTLDKLEKVEYDKIPGKLKSNLWIYRRGIANIGDKKYPVEISMAQTDGNKWKFTPETIKSIGRYAQALKEEKTVYGVTPLITDTSRLKGVMPAWTGETIFLFLNGQWLGIFLILILGFISGKIAKMYASRVLKRILKSDKISIKEKHKENVYFSMAFIVSSMVWLLGIRVLEFEDFYLSNLTRLGLLVLAISTVTFSYYLVELIASYFLKLSEKTENKFDDILVPLLKKIAQFFVVVIGFIVIGESFNFNMRAIIAGLGIGGLAFAFAAKDSISNLLGSLTVLLDKPFEIGDLLNIDGRIEGKVESVGLRSTRLRTLYGSEISIPNGLLTNTHIDNYGRRQRRRFQTNISVTYNTSPEKIEAFCEGIRELIISNNFTFKTEFHVFLGSMGDSSLNIHIIMYFEVPDFQTENNEKHRFLIDILRLAEKLGVEFAFPTRTVYKIDLENNPPQKIPDNVQVPQIYGKELAKKISETSISPRTPRSSKETALNFTKEDIS